MEELVKVSLENEMDLILSHKRAMKLAELAGLSLASQTTFATAVAEVGRYALEQGNRPQLMLGFDKSRNRQALVAMVEDKNLSVADPLNQGLLYARRLVEKMDMSSSATGNRIMLSSTLPASRKIDEGHIAQWRSQFEGKQPLSAYDEIKRKNDQLQELADRLHSSDQHYKRVTNSLPLMIFTANQAGQLLYGNSWVTDFTGYSIQTLNQLKWTRTIHPDDYENFWQLWAQRAAAELPFLCECRMREKESQTYLWHMFSAQPLKNDPDRVAAWTGFVVNIHAQKVVEQTLRENEELVQAKAKLEQAQQVLESTVSELNRSNTELTQFAYIASHDLQEPLRKIQQFGDLLRSRHTSDNNPLPDESLNYLVRIQAAASRMSTLISDLLAFSRLSTRWETALPISLADVVNGSLENLSLTIEESKAQIKLTNLPIITGDVIQLEQLFQNLLSNALKFRQIGVLPVVQISAQTISATDLPPSIKPLKITKAYHRIDVSDNGIGFDEKYLDRIFQVFQRLHSKNQYVGTGVGLAICQKVVTNHGGVITATSRIGEGTTFFVYLPA